MPTLSPRRIFFLALAAALFIVAWALLDVPPLAVLRQWADETGLWFPVLFWLLYIAVTQFPIPRTIMTVSSGILLGSALGITVAVTATMVSAVVSLLIVRFLLRDFVAPRLTHPSIETINQRLEARGWLAVASLRMIAFVPFSILNYTAALTRVPVLPFAIGTFVGSLPGTIVTVLFGDTLTGEASPVVVVATVILSLAGFAGLLADALLPASVKPDATSTRPGVKPQR